MKKTVTLTAAILTVSIILVAGMIFKTGAVGNVEYFSKKKQAMIWSIAKADISYMQNVAARISIPRLNKNMIVLSAPLKYRESKDYPFWVNDTDFPGTQGISLITGRNDTSFSFLRLLRDGDVILLETTDGQTVRYAVSSLVITEDEAVKVNNTQGQKILILVTRYEFANWQTDDDMRLVVIAREVKNTV